MFQGYYGALLQKCKKTVNVTADWHQKSRHQEAADRVVFPDDIERHAKGCDAISEQKVPEDVDQPAPGATPLANPARLSRKDSFDPAAIHSLPLQPNSLCQWEAGMTV
ncbi:hypothetical protein B0H10DRAFT_1971448 [Mycena sp. CBHHK59/15]|nr:hypothetical protein B0H10DRAFT_1971448 [Mycena sp. CBHHK59/15]